MAFPNPTGQTPTGQQDDPRAQALGAFPPSADADADWDAFGTEDPEAIYSSQDGEAVEPSRDPFAQDEGPQAPTTLDEVDLAGMSVEDRVAAVNGFLGVELPEDKALAIADGYMRNADYTKSKQTLAENQRMVQSLLQQQGYNPPDSLKQLNPFLQQQMQAPVAPMGPQAPQPPQPGQSEVPGPPLGSVAPYDRDGFLAWWGKHMERPATQGDFDRWQYEATYGQQQRQQQQEQWRGTVQAAISELDQLGQEFKHLQEPGVREAVEQIAYQRLTSGQAYPGMMREIYLGQFGTEAFRRQQLEQAPMQRPRRQAPPVGPGGPGGAPPRQEQNLRTAEGILAKQLGNEGLLRNLEQTLESDDPEGVYRSAAAQVRG